MKPDPVGRRIVPVLVAGLLLAGLIATAGMDGTIREHAANLATDLLNRVPGLFDTIWEQVRP